MHGHGQGGGYGGLPVPSATGFAAVDVPALRQRLRDQGASSTTPRPGTTTPDPPARAYPRWPSQPVNGRHGTGISRLPRPLP